MATYVKPCCFNHYDPTRCGKKPCCTKCPTYPGFYDWDRLAAEVGLPANWREQGYDSPEYMVSEDSLYMQDNGVLKCVWPNCNFRRRSVLAMFLHVHGKVHQ